MLCALPWVIARYDINEKFDVGRGGVVGLFGRGYAVGGVSTGTDAEEGGVFSCGMCCLCKREVGTWVKVARGLGLEEWDVWVCGDGLGAGVPVVCERWLVV